MEFTQLKQFKTVAETENTIDASNILGITQPALTKSIQNLENELETVLFDRTGRKLSLNSNGKTTLKYVNDMLHDIEDMMNDLKYAPPEANILKICCSINAVMTYIIPKFNFDYPDIPIYPQLRNIRKFQTYIEENIFDVALSTERLSTNSIVSKAFFKDWVVISVPKDHPLYNNEIIELYELEGQTFSGYRNSLVNPLPKLFETMLTSNSVSYKKKLYADINSLFHATESNSELMYSSTVGAMFRSKETHRRYIPINPNYNASLTYYASYRKKNSEKTAVFISWLRRQFDDYAIAFNK